MYARTRRRALIEATLLSGDDGRVRCDRRATHAYSVVTDVSVAILHLEPEDGAGRLVRATAEARLDLAERHRRGFLAAGATRATVITGPRDGIPFGARLRALAAGLGAGGLVILGSGAIPLATPADRRELVATAASERPRALTNNRYSGDVVAVACARSILADVPDLPADNALPRWLEEVAVPVEDRRDRRRLGVDIDGPADLLLLGGRWRRHLGDLGTAAVEQAIEGVRTVSADSRAELVIAGRVSAANLAWLESRTASRTRAFIEERGLRTRRPDQRPASSVLGALLDRDGPASLGDHLADWGMRRSSIRVCCWHTTSVPMRRLAAGRGPVRVGPLARRSDRRCLAPGADDVCRDRPDPGPARRPHLVGPGLPLAWDVAASIGS
jgi:CTP:molybdopterin cytidylyltransferase MocA